MIGRGVGDCVVYARASDDGVAGKARDGVRMDLDGKGACRQERHVGEDGSGRAMGRGRMVGANERITRTENTRFYSGEAQTKLKPKTKAKPETTFSP